MANVFRSMDNPTRREQTLVLIKKRIGELMVEIASDEVLMAEVVAGGIDVWRARMSAAFAPFPIGDAPDAVFRFFAGKVIQLFEADATRAQAEARVEDAKRLAGAFLDAVEPITPPTAKEVAAAWEIEDASSEDGKKLLYGDLHPKEYLERLVTEKEPT